jgi:aspartyl-tRNA(Asn)/glutamyl-tRNA(Gln) amidotransferase subunit B
MKLTPAYLAEVIRLVDAGTINGNTGKALLAKINETGRSPSSLIEAEGLARVSDDAAIRAVVDEVLAESPKEIETYRAGKVTLMGWFVGQVMRKMRGKADANVARKILEEKLTADS